LVTPILQFILQELDVAILIGDALILLPELHFEE
jgi:hypothetical protein